MRRLALWILFSAMVCAQIQTIDPNSPVSSAPPILNYNFNFLATTKVAIWSGSGPPGSIALSLLGDLYINTISTPRSTYQCVTTSCGPGTWQLIAPTGGAPIIAPTTYTLRGDGAGNAIPVTGTSNNCVLVNGNSGSCGPGSSPGGASGQVQFNSSGSFGGISGTGIIRNGGTASELSGDVVTSGSNATSVQKVNGGAVPGNATALSSNSSSQIVAATLQGNGAKVQLSTGSTTTNDCVKFDANGNTVDAGAACGSGNSSGLFNVSATTTVVTIPAAQYRNNNAITNISTIGTITAGSGSLATGAQIWCYWNPASPSVPICDYNSNVTSSGLTFSNASLGNGSASSYPDCVVPIATITGGTPANEWIAVTNAPFAVSTQCEQAGTNMTKSVGSNGVTTWSSTASGGSSLFSNSQGYQAATNLTGVGNDIAIFTTPSIASLPGTVNSCVAVHTLITDVSGATGLTMKLRADYVSSASPGTLIATLKSSWGSSGESDILNFDYCNDAGSQTAQHIDDTYSSYVTSGTINLQINSMGLSAAATNALTWSSAHTLSITVSGATCTGCVQGIEFSADQK